MCGPPTASLHALQKHGSEINDVGDKDLGYTALHIAAWNGFHPIVRELLLRGANADLQDRVRHGWISLARRRRASSAPAVSRDEPSRRRQLVC